MIIINDFIRSKAALIDYTNLSPLAGRGEISHLCRQGDEYTFAAVCLLPCWVKTASRLLESSLCKVCAVVGFPLGGNTRKTKAYEAARAMDEGAGEIDMVMNIAAFKDGDADYVYREIKAVAKACENLPLKVIIEACYLSDEEKVCACHLAAEGGAAFVKTSTGWGKGGAVVRDVALLRQTAGERLGVKAAGGITSADLMEQMLSAGASRIGASAALNILEGYMSRIT
jgi:deoxyribose-phosphate aldolase